MMRIKFIYLLLFIGAIWPASLVLAKEDCQNATTSADVMRCVKQNHEAAQAKLNDLYKALSLRKSGDLLTQMQALQALWIEYRDRECEAETRALENETLKRLEGIKCKTRLMHERINALQKTLDTETGSAVLGEPPSTQQPRWVNVLSQKYPDIYWHYGGFGKGDLDCDDDAEYAIAGLRFDEKDSLYKTVIAVSENPATGRPSSRLISLPDAVDEKNVAGEDSEQLKQCSGIMFFSFEAPPELAANAQENITAPSEAGNENEAESEAAVPPVQEMECGRRLIITRKTSDKSAICPPVAVFWDGQNYVIEQ